MFRDALPQHYAARRLLIGTASSAIGRGLTLPFLYIYLTKVRDIAPTTAGLVIGWLGLTSLIIAPMGGSLVDRLGARRVVLPMLLVEAVGVASLALVTEPWHAFAAITLVAIGGGVIWSAMATIMSSVTPTRNARGSSASSSRCSTSASDRRDDLRHRRRHRPAGHLPG